MDEEGLSEEELEGILKQNPQMGITAEKRKELTEQVTAPILKEAEERMTQAVRSRKPVEGLTRQEQIEATPEGQIPARPSGVPSPKADQIALPTTLPKHGIRALFSEGERILERASQVTNLPPESPATQAIAQRMAKGDPFSSEALEDAKAETMRLVKAGLIPNPYYEGFTGKISQAYDILAPLSVEIGVPVATSVALAPLSVNPPLYFSMLGLSSGAANLFAQQMRIGAGFQDETSYMEAAAAAGWGWLPGINIRRLKDASSTVKSIAGGIEGAVMAGGENLTHQGLEMLYGKQKELKGSELLLTSGGGAVIGTVIKRIGAALDIKYDPKEKPYPLIRKAIKDEIKGVRKELNRLKKQGQVRGLKGHQERLDQLEKKLEDLPKPQDDVYQRAIDLLEQHEKQQVESFELFAKEWQESKAAQAIKESDVPTAKEPEVTLEVGELPKTLRELKQNFINKKLAVPAREGEFPYIETPEGYFKQGNVYRHKDDPNFKVEETDAEGVVKLAEDIANEAGGAGVYNLKRHMGPMSNPEDASKALKDKAEELAPIQEKQRDLLRKKYGDTVTVYRVEDPDFTPSPERDVSSWSLERQSVEDRLQVEGTVLKEKTIAVDDVQFVYNYRETEVLLRDDVPTAKVEEAKVETEPEAWDPTEVPLGIRRTPVIEPELAALDDEALELAQKQALKDAEPLEDEFFGYPTKGAWFTAPKDLARRLGEAQDKVTAIELEIFRRQIDTEEPWFVATEFNKLTGATEDAENTFKLALLGETIQKRGIQKEVAKELEDKFGRGADAQEVLISKIETAQKAMKTMAEQKKQLQAPMEAPAAEPAPVVTAKPEGEVKQQAREALDDFMAGGGTREVDPLTGKLLDSDDEIKARLLTDDEEKRRLINSVQEAIKEDLANIKGGRESQVEYLAKVQRELDRRLGRETGDEHALVLRAAQLSDNLEVADAINELSIQMTANGVVMVKAFDDILKLAKEKNLDNKADLNDLQTSILKTIPLMLGWKKVGTASGRLLQSRKYTKDQLEVQIEELEKQMEENLVSNLKASKDLTPEELDKQIESFGDIKAVKSLLKAVQQSDDVEELKNILMEQQQTFQNKSSLKKFLDDDTSTYTKVRDVGIDVTYSSMLSAPSTLIKVGIGNAVMSRYHTWMGKVGAKYMALAPWARQGMTKQQFEEAYNFWSKVAMSYGDFNDLALKEGRKAFKTGISDLQTHYESFGESALSMERTGISGALGQSLENAGQFIDVPGKAMARLDARARIRIAHAMTKAKAEYDWRVAKAEGEEVPDNFDEYYQGFLRKVFTEDQARLMTEDQVRRQALLNAEKEGVKAENLASYIDNYVKNNWDKDTSNFVSYVQRNIKEITFTEELGEFTDINKVEAGTKKIESILNDFPLLKTIINPFQRTGRNIIREGLSSTSALASVPGLSKYADKIWAKTMQDLNSGDPIIAARAKGRQVVGAGIIAAAWGLAEAGLYEGMIDQNWKKEENFSIGTGLNPYELRIPIGDQVIGQDINSLEPFATIMNIVADVHTLSKGRMSHKKEAMSALYMLSLVVSNNIGNKSYFKNIGDALELIQVTVESEEAVEAKQKRIIKRLGAGVVPSIMNSMSKATDDWQRRGDTMLNAIAKKISLIAREVPPERDMFGDPIPLHKTDRAKLVSIINPFRLGKQIMDVDDYVITDENGFRGFDLEKLKSIELRETIKGKPNPKYNEQEVRNAAWAIALELDGTYHFNGGSTIKNDIDLQEVIHPETRIDAFHAWQKEYKNLRIDGLTVKQAVIDLAKSWSDSEIDKKTGKVKSVEYVKFDPKKNPEGFKQKDVRLSDLNALLNDYKNVAYDNIEQQYPILLEQKEEEAIRQELQYKRPTTEEAKRLASEMPLQEYKKTQPDTKLKELISKTPYFPAALSD